MKRVVILGLDGMDHGLSEKMLEEGKLPNLAMLRDQGCFRPLGSTVPPISPVAWSTFQTGVNPGKHNIFDFLTPDLRTYQAKLSSVEIRPPRRSLTIGRYQVPLGKAERAPAPQEQTVLERPQQVRHLQLHYPRPDYISPRETARGTAVGDVRPRPARYPGDVLFLHDPRTRRR